MEKMRYQNKRNADKYITVKRYSDGHYYAQQTIEKENPITGKLVILYVGCRHSHSHYRRHSKRTLSGILEDYQRIN